MEVPLESQMNEIMSQPGVTGVLCSDNQGLALADKISHVTSDTRPSHFSACNIEKLGMGLGAAQGTLKAESAGVVAGLASKASQLKQGTGADDQPVVVVEFDTGNVLIRSHGNSTLAVHKV